MRPTGSVCCHPAPLVPAAATLACGSSLTGSGSHLSILTQQHPVNERILGWFFFMLCSAQYLTVLLSRYQMLYVSHCQQCQTL